MEMTWIKPKVAWYDMNTIHCVLSNLYKRRLIIVEKFSEAGVDVRTIPERAHEHLGHLRAVESFAKRPHEGSVNSDQLSRVNWVWFVEDNPQLEKSQALIS